jgi:hypothetical protein
MPLWRLLVALSDAERVAGSNSSTARALAREINRRLAGPPPTETAEEKAALLRVADPADPRGPWNGGTTPHSS